MPEECVGFIFFPLSISTDGNGEFEKPSHSFDLTDSMKGVALLGDSVFCLSYDAKEPGIMPYVEVGKVPPFVTSQIGIYHVPDSSRYI